MDFPAARPRPDSFRSPGYPLLIALGILMTNGLNFFPFTLYVQAVIGILSVALTYLLSRRFMSAFSSIFSALLVGLSPHMVVMSGYFLSETLFGFLLLAALTLFHFGAGSRKLKMFVFSGLIFGCAYLTNETLLFLPFLLAGLTICGRFGQLTDVTKKRIFVQIASFLAVFCIFPLAWSVRNLMVLQPESPTGYERAVQSMSHGAYPDFIYKDPGHKFYPYLEDPMQPQFGSSIGDFVNILGLRIRQRPVRYLTWYLLEKPYYLWNWNILQGQGDIYVYSVKASLYDENQIAEFTKNLMKLIHPWLLLLCLANIPVLFLTYRHFKPESNVRCPPDMVFLVCLYYTVLYSVFVSWPRYSVALRPELYICAVWIFDVTVRHIIQKAKR
jgi:4-amino-4-deoxy-L-arabinose transferase-like glycosyltransferase